LDFFIYINNVVKKYCTSTYQVENNSGPCCCSRGNCSENFSDHFEKREKSHKLAIDIHQHFDKGPHTGTTREQENNHPWVGTQLSTRLPDSDRYSATHGILVNQNVQSVSGLRHLSFPTDNRAVGHELPAYRSTARGHGTTEERSRLSFTWWKWEMKIDRGIETGILNDCNAGARAPPTGITCTSSTLTEIIPVINSEYHYQGLQLSKSDLGEGDRKIVAI
jgi:hypothetical protein